MALLSYKGNILFGALVLHLRILGKAISPTNIKYDNNFGKHK